MACAAGPSTSLSFVLPEAAHVHLTIHDLEGRTVAILADGMRNPGHYTHIWTPAAAPGDRRGAGIYFVRLKADNQIRAGRIVRVR